MKLSIIMLKRINENNKKITEEQNSRFEKIYDSISINITIGNNTITIPNNADNIESIISALKECREQTL